MMEGIALALLVCLFFALISKRFNFPPIPMYILAGIILGTTGLGIVETSGISDFLTSLGLIFLLFTMGLEIKPSEFMKKKDSFFAVGVIDFGVNILIGFFGSVLLGFPISDAVVIACAFYISSSAIAVASLIENRKLANPESETILWLMVFEDVVLLIIIVLFSASGKNPVETLGTAFAVIAAFFIIVKLLKSQISAILERDDEIPLLFTFTLVITVAGISDFLGIPETLTAIALGSALSITNGEALERHAMPFRDVFLILFFVFFGISVDLSSGVDILPVIGISVLAVLSKLVSGVIIGKKIHRSALSGIEIWSETTGRGEFSLAIAGYYGSPLISGTVAVMVVITSFVGGMMGKHSRNIKKAFAGFLMSRREV
ncbi:CPA2 family monovalent cation:H+ antiporter-2 [Methanomicrobium sp. W14]|uniref:cation:proton antiporter n=1 Tax=Methanomicrobium sp. W14 TaxID=2817839 RepID=UPI001AE82ACA|nr:cation:proton antiporter [Methanomicrobium sp. W14]MBP2133418.1 CPA2 family monovalent cation:H+ antiporter-2 [Methanomicrobium sp. W14]